MIAEDTLHISSTADAGSHSRKAASVTVISRAGTGREIEEYRAEAIGNRG